MSRNAASVVIAAGAAGAVLGLVALKAQPPDQPPTQPVQAVSMTQPIIHPAAGALAPRVKTSSSLSPLRRADGFDILPDPQLTPGAVLTTDAATVARPGYAGSVRSVSQDTKDGRFRAYNIAPAPGQHFEIDHLISLELGGSNDPANLWPEPYFGAWNAHDKDQLEDRLHTLVCSGRLTLPEAQQAIRSDWCAAYRLYLNPNGPASAGPAVTKGGD